MQPIKIKYYGLIPMTKKARLILTAVGALSALFVLVLLAFTGGLPPWRWPWEPAARAQHSLVDWIYNNCYWLILGFLVLEALDVYTVLRVFTKKEAEQRTRLAQTRTATPNP
jgi:hypothetical protein